MFFHVPGRCCCQIMVHSRQFPIVSSSRERALLIFDHRRQPIVSSVLSCPAIKSMIVANVLSSARQCLVFRAFGRSKKRRRAGSSWQLVWFSFSPRCEDFSPTQVFLFDVRCLEIDDTGVHSPPSIFAEANKQWIDSTNLKSRTLARIDDPLTFLSPFSFCITFSSPPWQILSAVIFFRWALVESLARL